MSKASYKYDLANYKYYLANGERIEYSLSPDSRLTDVISNIVSFYYLATGSYCNITDEIWVRPEILTALWIEWTGSTHSSPSYNGFQNMKLQTSEAVVTIIAKCNLEFPIFMGSEQELKDNGFNTFMEEILCE